MDVTPDMIDRITREVLAVLRERGVQPVARSNAHGVANAYGGPTQRPAPNYPQPRAEVHPPIGICTGDYSKFPELAGKLYPSNSNPSSNPPAANAGQSTPSKPATPAYANPVLPSHPMASKRPLPQSPVAPRTGGILQNNALRHTPASPVANSAGDVSGNPLPLSGIITANQLKAAMDASNDGVALLARDARLTPLAADLARQHPEKIRRVDPGSSAPSASNAAPANGLPWVWWIDGSCPAVSKIVSTHSTQLRAAGAAVSLTQTVRDLASLVRSNQVAGGLLFVRNASRAMCYANRCTSLRAVVGTCFEAVEQGVDQLGANVLVLEYPYQGPHAMEAMVQRVLAQQPRVPAAIERELSDLHRCG